MKATEDPRDMEGGGIHVRGKVKIVGEVEAWGCNSGVVLTTATGVTSVWLTLNLIEHEIFLPNTILPSAQHVPPAP